MLVELQKAIRRDDIDMVRQQRLAAMHLDDGHSRARAQNLRQFAAVFRVEMHDNNERRAGIFRQGSEELLQRLDAPCGRAHRDQRLSGILLF